MASSLKELCINKCMEILRTGGDTTVALEIKNEISNLPEALITYMAAKSRQYPELPPPFMHNFITRQ